jgi:hypothetical protein
MPATTFIPQHPDDSVATLIKRLANVVYKQPKVRYLTYLRSPQWQQVRRAHLEYADYWCKICKKERAFQVHHWTYARLGNEHPMDLSAVCVTCHHRIHCAVMPPANDNEQLELDFKPPSSSHA